MREKLIELWHKAEEDADRRCDEMESCEVCPADKTKCDCQDWMLADALIANGVTFAEDNNVPSKWIPVTERLPERYGKYLCRYVFDESAEYPHFEVISFYAHLEKPRFQGEGSCGMRVTHWMPLPEPPKQ